MNELINKKGISKISVKLVGVLFLLQMAAASVSHSAMLAPLLYGDNMLPDVAAHPHAVTVAMLLDILCGAAVFTISVILFPLFKKINESMAIWYVGLRLNEWLCTLVSGIFLLALLALAKEYVQTALPGKLALATTGTYLLKVRGYTKVLMLLVFCLNAPVFYYLLFRSKLVPRFISIWGMVGVILLFAEITSNIFGHTLGGILIMLPMGLNEIFLGLWLIIKGFNSQVINHLSSKQD